MKLKVSLSHCAYANKAQYDNGIAIFCLSIHPSTTLCYRVKMAKQIVMIPSPSDRPIVLVFSELNMAVKFLRCQPLALH